MTPWTFGVAPLSQTVDAAARLRDVIGLLLASEEEHPAVDRLLIELERAVSELRDAPSERPPRVGANIDAADRVYLDHGYDIGRYNPCVPVYELTADGDRASGSVTFPIAYEGPPGFVHGGFLALFFDCAVQQHNCAVGVAGKTTALTSRFRHPTPLLLPLAFTIERDADATRIRSAGRLFDGEVLLCEVAVESIAGDRSRLPDVDPRRGS